MKKTKFMLFFSLLLSVILPKNAVYADESYEFYDDFKEIYTAIEQSNPYVQNQVSKAIIKNGSIYVADGWGQCNASSLTTLLNRRLAYDNNYSSDTMFRINEVFSANGVSLKYESEKTAQTGNKGYHCYVFDNNKDTGGWAKTGKQYSNRNKTVTYTVRSISGNDWKNKNNNPEGITDFYEYIVYLLMQHPEGICVRNSSSNHVAVVVSYERTSNGKIQLYMKDPAIRTDNGKTYKDTKKLEETYLYKHGGTTYDLKSGFQFFTYLEGSEPVSPCGGNHTAEYFDKGINKCRICNKYNYIRDDKIAIKNGSYVVINDGTRLREGPYDNDTSIALEQIPGGAEVQVRQAVNNVFGNTWYKVSYNGRTGFVFYEKLLYAGMTNPYSYGKYSSQLKSGSKGSSVKFLQQALNVVMNSGLSVDGQFGTNTKNAVKAFQKKYGLTQDGIYGKNSNSKMETVLKEMGYGTDGKPWSKRETAEGHKSSPAAEKTVSETYRLAYDAAGGSGAPEDVKAAANEKIIVSSSVPSRKGWTFSGWSYKEGGNPDIYPGDTFTISGNTTLYAVWSAETYLITFDDNGGYQGPGGQSFAYGSGKSLVNVRPERESYRFTGWKDSASGNMYHPGDAIPADWTDRTLIAQWEAENNQNASDSGAEDGLTDPIQETAGDISELVSYMMGYTVSYDANGGCNVPESTDQVGGEGLTLSSQVPSRDGYMFKGWSYSPNGTADYMPGDWYSENRSVTLYAVWEKEAPREKNPYDYGSYSRQLKYKSSMMRGEDVKFLQQALNIVVGSRLEVDGIFGTKTRDAVKAFQKQYSLDVDGIYGPNSNKKMEQLLSDLGYSK